MSPVSSTGEVVSSFGDSSDLDLGALGKAREGDRVWCQRGTCAGKGEAPQSLSFPMCKMKDLCKRSFEEGSLL